MGAPVQLDPRGLPAGYPFRPEYEVLARDAAARLAAGQLVLVDVRTIEEVGVARVAGAIHVPLNELESRFEEVERAAETRPGAAVAFLCHHGVRSMKAALFARGRGIEGAMSVAGGIDLWSLGVDAGVARY